MFRIAAVTATAAVLIAIIGFYGNFVVGPQQVAIVTQAGKIVGVRQPSLRWHVPILQQVTYIDVARIHKHIVKITIALSDGTKCGVRAVLLYRVQDPILAYKWRTA